MKVLLPGALFLATAYALAINSSTNDTTTPSLLHTAALEDIVEILAGEDTLDDSPMNTTVPDYNISMPSKITLNVTHHYPGLYIIGNSHQNATPDDDEGDDADEDDEVLLDLGPVASNVSVGNGSNSTVSGTAPVQAIVIGDDGDDDAEEDGA